MHNSDDDDDIFEGLGMSINLWTLHAVGYSYNYVQGRRILTNMYIWKGGGDNNKILQN